MGKCWRPAPGGGTCCQTKSPKRRRSLRGMHTVDPTDKYRILQNLPFSH